NRPDDECRALGNLASRQTQAGRNSDAVATARMGMDLARRHGMVRFYGAFISATAALALLRLGRWDDADRVSRTMLERGPSTVSGIELRLLRTTLELRRGNDDAAEALLDEVAKLVAGVESTNFWGQLLIARAELAVARGQHDDVVTAVRQGLELVASTDEESCGPE